MNRRPAARQPRGTPAGGRFAEQPRPPAEVELEVDPAWRSPEPGEWDTEDLDNGTLSTRTYRSDSVFDERARLLLGVPAGTKVRGGPNMALGAGGDDEGYDADVAWEQLVDAGYDPDIARQVADSADDYDSAYERIVLAAGR